MLQQTRVEAVLPYYARWLRAFPTMAALARAKDDRVLKLWEGLGYYSRARNLHRAAQIVVRAHGSKLSRTAEELRQLPGIGPYTAGAIASIAFDERVPLVDGNVARVFARVFAIHANVKAPRTLQTLWQLAEDLVPETKPGDFNQALMELGALVCMPVNPRCGVCPMHRVCVARARGLVERLPNRGDKPRMVRVVTEAAFVRRGGRILLQRRPKDGLLANFWELPLADKQRFRTRGQLCEVQHAITQHRITLRVFACTPIGRLSPNEQWQWASRKQLKSLALPAAHRRAIGHILSTE